MLVCFLLPLCFVSSGTRVEAVESSVKITTIPSQGPFRINQRVQFSCEMKPAQTDSVTYQWRNVEYINNRRSSFFSRSFNRSFSSRHLRYCSYFCIITLNGTIFGSADRFVEVHGLLQTDEQVTRAFTPNEMMAMRINILDYYNLKHHIGSLAWYHNGTRLTSDDRFKITNNGTSLTIRNMIESDAGKYEVKINSDPDELNSAFCDANILPQLENGAIHAPVMFLLQKMYQPTYSPEDIIMNYVLPAYQCTPHRTFTIDNTFNINAAAVLINLSRIKNILYKDGVSISDRNMYNSNVLYDSIIRQSLKITYNNTDDIVGLYVHQAYGYYFDINSVSCPGYFYYLSSFPIFTLYWNIRSSNTPVLYLWPDKTVLTSQEINTIECDVHNCISSNMSLWHNQKMLVQINGTYIQHHFKTSQFGVFICQADNVSNSSLVQEKAQIQILLEATELTCCGTALDLQMAVIALLYTQCEDCKIDVDNLEGTYLNYSASGRSAYFIANLIYSNTEGTITSSTLITRLWSWLLADENPNITISGNSIALSKKCPMPANRFTIEACMNQLHTSEKATTSVIVSVFAGLVAGIFMGGIGAISILLLLFCLYKKRCKNYALATDKNADQDDMSINLAYGDEPHYTDQRVMSPIDERTEHIYEYPVQDTTII